MRKRKYVYQVVGKKKKSFETSNLYRTVGKMLVQEKCEVPVTVIVRDAIEETEMAQYVVKKRRGKVCVVEERNTFPNKTENLEEVYLTYVDPETNAYRFYRLTPLGDEVKASWGRMGTEKGQQYGEKSYIYPARMYGIKLAEKFHEGLQDNSDVYLAKDTPAEAPSEIHLAAKNKKSRAVNMASKKLFSLLSAFSKGAVEDAQVAVPITGAILQKTAELIDKMRNTASLEEFNKVLMENIAILQRPVRTGSKDIGVQSLLAAKESDLSSVIEREEDLLEAMRGVYFGLPVEKEEKNFGSYDIEVFEATEEQKETVIRHLSRNLKGSVQNVYRVIPKAQQKRFDGYCKKNNIKDVKMFWHGSRNENFLSIAINGLQLRPNAVITGKMFGYGTYFAPSSMKSVGYTSRSGSKWARGNSRTYIMGLYAVAYGKPYDVYSHSGYMTTLTENDILKKGCNSLHAHKGSMLRNDEVVVYNEAATCLQYLVVFRD